MLACLFVFCNYLILMNPLQSEQNLDYPRFSIYLVIEHICFLLFCKHTKGNTDITLTSKGEYVKVYTSYNSSGDSIPILAYYISRHGDSPVQKRASFMQMACTKHCPSGRRNGASCPNSEGRSIHLNQSVDV